MGYLGPLPIEKYCLVLINQRSRFSIVACKTSTNAITVLENFFEQYGLSDKVITDNGPPFTSTNLKNHFKRKIIFHRKLTPRWPKANGEVDTFMQPLSKIINTAYIEKTDWENSVHQFLYSHRNTPHSVTKIPLAELMFRKIQFTILEISNKTDESMKEKTEQNDQRNQEKLKHCQDQK